MQPKLLSQFQQDMQLRGLGELTQQAYLNKVEKFGEQFLALASWDEEAGVWRPRRVFVQPDEIREDEG